MTAETISLKFPIEVGGKTITEITLRRPKVKDMPLLARIGEIEAAKVNDTLPKDLEAEATFLLIRAVTGLPEAVVGEIDMLDDFPAIAEAAAGFLESISPTAQPSGGQ